MKFKRFPLGALWTNTYLVWDDSGAAFLADPAGNAEEILSFAKENGLNLTTVLLTHGHLDHIGGIDSLREFAAPKFYIGAGDASMLRSPDQTVAQWMECDFKGIEDFSTLSDGDVLMIGAMNVSVIETPGHTPGCVCYLVSEPGREGAPWEEMLLLSGDTLFARSVGRTDLPGGDGKRLQQSLLRLSSLPDDLRVLPGHGPETTIGAERIHNSFWPGEGE